MSNKKKIKVKKPKKEEKVDSLTLLVRDSLGSVGRGVNPYQEQMLVQLVKAFLVGGLATIIDLILFIILSIITSINPLIINIITMLIITIFGYFMSCKYVFDKKNKKLMMRDFVILSIVGFLITEGLLFGLVIKISWNEILVKILAIVLALIIKFLIRRFILSKK